MNKTHESYMKRMKANNKMNITRVMHMTMQERKNLLQRMEHRNQWKQVSLKALEFFTESETNNNNEPTMTANKRTMQTVQREADKRARKIQLNFTQFCTTNKSNQSKKEKRKVKSKTQKQKLAQSNNKKQLTLKTATMNGKRKLTIGKQRITKKNKTDVQEMEREKMELLYDM